MKKYIIVLICSFFILSISAQHPIPVGKGSYAEYTPLSKSRTDEHGGDQSRLMENKKIYITEKNKGLPVPTNDWWTDLIVSQYSGNLWAYPQVVKAEEYGIFVAFPKEWEATGRELKWKTQLEVLGKKFKPASADANSWHDWGFDFLMKDNEKEMLVTLAHGVPFTWVETKNIDLQLRMKNANYYSKDGKIEFPYTGSEIVIQSGNDAYGIYAPTGTVFIEKNDLIEVVFPGEKQYLSIAVLPSKEDLMAYATYAYTIPRQTNVNWNYNESTGKVETQWNINTENLKDENQLNILQGFIPHHYKNSEHTFSFLPYEYATPRGKMKMSAGKSFSITYKFNGMLPYFAVPQKNAMLKNPYQHERMKQQISEYTDKGGFGADTYWGGKGLIQMGLYMTFAYETGEMELFEKCKNRLKSVLIDWLTYTPGENSFFFARYNRWGSLVGYDTSYDSDTFNDHHFHYGYYTYASSLLALFDEDFKNNYGEMISLIAKDYANWDKNDKQFPFFRTFDPWAGHSYAGGLGSYNGNGQESTSEAMQGWGGMYLLGMATNNKAMRDAGIFGWTLEARGIAEYWFDRDRENIDYNKYDKPYNSNLTSQGIGWWTWFSGDPVWMHSIQWMPISPCMNHLHEDLEFARWDYTQMWKSKEVGSWTTQTGLPSSLSYESGLGNVVLSYLQVFDPDSAAAVFDNMWDAQMPVVKNPDTGGISYYITHSHRTYGDICWNIHANTPTATVYKHPKTNKLTFVVYNPEATEKTIVFYQNNAVIKQFKAPANRMTVYSDAPVLSSIKIKEPACKVVEPGKTLQLDAELFDQYGASMTGNVSWSINQGGNVSNKGLFTAGSTKGINATISVQSGTFKDQIVLKVNDKPELRTARLLPERTYLEIGKTLDYSLEMIDQYGESYPENVSWEISKEGKIVKTDAVFDLQTIGIYTVKAMVEGKTYSRDIYLTPTFSNIALNKTAVASSEENVGTIAKYATDGNMQTRWGSQHTDPQWIYIDLGSSSYISHVSIVWEAAYASLYDIQVTDNLQNWETVKTVNGMGGTSTIDINKQARYVRMYGKERASTYGYSLYEFEVYGVPPTGTDPALFGIDLQPQSVQLKEGETLQLQAIGYDQFGKTMTVNPQFRIVSGEGSITETGKFTASQFGAVVVEAKVSNQTAKTTFFVEEAIKLKKLSISPKKALLIKGENITFNCSSEDQFGIAFPSENLTYSVIGKGGNLSGSIFSSNATGEYQIIAGSGEIKDTAYVQVSEIQDINLAFQKPVTASSSENAGTLPSFVNDGDTDTRWSSAFSTPEFIQVDLSDNFVINEIRISWDAAYATSYHIETSLDEENWNIVCSTVNGNGGDLMIPIEKTAARYVRVMCLERKTQYGSSIWELEVYGSSRWQNPQPATIRVNSNPVIAYMGESIQLEARLFDQYGLKYAADKNCQWSIDGGASIDASGKMTPTETGDFILTVQYEQLTKTFPVQILSKKQLARLEITPVYALVKTGETAQLSATGFDQFGNSMSVTPTWKCSGGNITGENSFSSDVKGEFQITATFNNLSTTAQIVVIEADRQNLALNKTATTSSGNGKAAVDGNTGTRWESDFVEGPEWIMVDLEDAYQITDAEVFWETASARNYEVQISKDGENWTKLKDVSSMSGQRTDTWRVNGIGRYVRIWCTNRSTDYGYSIWELRLYGALLPAGEPYSITFINPQTDLSINEKVQYKVQVSDKNGTLLINPALHWSIQGLGNISEKGEFVSLFSGITELSVSSKMATANLNITIPSLTSNSEITTKDDHIHAWISNQTLHVEGKCLEGIWIYDIYGRLISGSTFKPADTFEKTLPGGKGIILVRIKTENKIQTIKLTHL